MIADATAIALIPDELSAVDAAPMLCAGVSTYNALKRCGAAPGDLVAIQGCGGLGHLAVQFAVRMGFKVAAIDRGSDREALAKKLGAHCYINTEIQDVAAELTALGGAGAIIATAPNAKAMGDVVDGLSLHGVLMVLGVPEEPVPVLARLMLSGRSIKGTAGGVAVDCEDTFKFSVLNEVRPMIETFPLERAAEAYDKMMSGKARFRIVLTTGL
jgi:D-arabinose 1-dehydrogenase-like Zn-dependent alcohol dehydrogenase